MLSRKLIRALSAAIQVLVPAPLGRPDSTDITTVTFAVQHGKNVISGKEGRTRCENGLAIAVSLVESDEHSRIPRSDLGDLAA